MCLVSVRPTRSTTTDPHVPYTTLFRFAGRRPGGAALVRHRGHRPRRPAGAGPEPEHLRADPRLRLLRPRLRALPADRPGGHRPRDRPQPRLRPGILRGRPVRLKRPSLRGSRSRPLARTLRDDDWGVKAAPPVREMILRFP